MIMFAYTIQNTLVSPGTSGASGTEKANLKSLVIFILNLIFFTVFN